MEKHNEATIKFGFDLKATVLESIFSSKFIQNSMAVAGIASALRRPWEAAAGGVASIALEIGNAILKLERRQFEFTQLVTSYFLSSVVTQ